MNHFMARTRCLRTRRHEPRRPRSPRKSDRGQAIDLAGRDDSERKSKSKACRAKNRKARRSTNQIAGVRFDLCGTSPPHDALRCAAPTSSSDSSPARSNLCRWTPHPPANTPTPSGGDGLPKADPSLHGPHLAHRHRGSTTRHADPPRSSEALSQLLHLVTSRLVTPQRLLRPSIRIVCTRNDTETLVAPPLRKRGVGGQARRLAIQEEDR